MQAVLLQKAKVLATAPSNIAVDNILEKLVANEKINVVRIGHPARMIDSVRPYCLDAMLEDKEYAKLNEKIRKDMNRLREKLVKAKTKEEKRGLRAELKEYRRGLKVNQ